ncbi:sensor histidine kinase [Erysipelothrix aquatica]|uniref:sensor histidine kinase n=1 Tax=Erysipelothrix aquatica TaxID=2683714 RepID=UPI00135B9302|nr:HAMP domain-containing sensor histidine kinase [Erysipelothrix aquatica]
MKQLRNRDVKFFLTQVSIGFLVAVVIEYRFPFVGLVFFAILLIICFYQFVRQRNQAIEDVVAYLRTLNNGDYHHDIQAYEEGELSTLHAELNKTMIAMKGTAYQLQLQKQGLKKAMEDISHQLKTPLTALSIMVEVETLEQELSETMTLQLRRMENLVLSLNKIVQLETHMIAFKMEPISLNKLMAQLLTAIEPQLYEAKLTVNNLIKDTLIECDYNQTYEAISNVLVNKIRYAQTMITIQTRKSGRTIEVVIKDDGVEISPRDRERIFERFYSGMNKAPDSVGIGLSMAREIMHQQHGALYVEADNAFVFRF